MSVLPACSISDTSGATLPALCLDIHFVSPAARLACSRVVVQEHLHSFNDLDNRFCIRRPAMEKEPADAADTAAEAAVAAEAADEAACGPKLPSALACMAVDGSNVAILFRGYGQPRPAANPNAKLCK